MRNVSFVIGLFLLISCASQSYNSDISKPTGIIKITVNPRANHDGIGTVFVSGDHPNLWQEVLIESGYNVVDRSKIETIINEQALSLAGLSKEDQNFKVGEIIGADAFILTKRTANTFGTIGSWEDEVKMLSIKTGEILFISNYTSAYSGVEGMAQVINDWGKWKDDLFMQYKIKLNEEISNAR